MLTRLEQAQKAWGGSHDAIDNWLNERQDVLVSYCKLAGLPPYTADKQTLPEVDNIKQFCQLLVDYISAGHFEVYDRIVSQCEINGGKHKLLAEEQQARLTETTQAALEFNDLYAESTESDDLDGFDQNMAALGNALEVRFELEDQLIATLFESASNKAETA
ncbi:MULTISPECIES: sigma D regulator [Corallincola]|uniref:Sigma D regulator n=3 Tax=Corallincola TaxID=1775176 RepID=A0A368MZY0_9GAMM|nr:MULTISPECIES: sigma D regulator [Corallincola]RCU43788.1 sigma D regulator [Corallincola holothuriorum]TAA46903.1 sigma D regulator [Corallincola spongiicola]TCI04551.1 sigma D regulator [Corallincola luteus]